MTGRITRLVDDQQLGMIAGEDGVDYLFESHSLLGVTFGALPRRSASNLRAGGWDQARDDRQNRGASEPVAVGYKSDRHGV